MASISEKLLLKQITDLTREIENKKKGFDRHQYKSKILVKPWSKKSSTTFYNAYAHANNSKQWHKPGVSAVPKTQPEKSTNLKLPAKHPDKQHQHLFENHDTVSKAMTSKAKQVFVNPNFVPGKVGISVHVNPNFQSQSPAVNPAKGVSSVAVAGPSSAGAASLLASVPVAVKSQASGSAPAPVPVTALPRPVVPPAVVPVPVPVIPAAVRTRRRSLSRYRLLTARKLVRRRSGETARDQQPSTSARQQSSVSAPLVSTRHKLVRAGAAPRTQRTTTSSRPTATRVVGSSPWRLGAARTGASRYRLVRKAPAATAVVVAAVSSRPVASSQHRTWRRRSSSSTSITPVRLTSTGSLRLGAARFVNIGGLLYRSTARKLQRASLKSPAHKNAKQAAAAPSARTPVSRSPGWISVRGARFRVEAGGRSLRRVDSTRPAPPRLDIGGVTFRQAGDGTLTADGSRQVNRTLISRAKSRSLAVLRARLRLSRQPCRFFCRLGRCRRHERDQCPHVHDDALRPVCTRHLQEGGCRRPGCTYNHAPRPEKVPHCLHFLTAECRRGDACPYMHVNVDADAPLCAKFLAGFCDRGQNCNDKHLYMCPEFSEKGECPRGTSCPLAHRVRRRLRRSSSAAAAAAAAAAKEAPPRGRGRYYIGEKPKAAAEKEEAEAVGDTDGESEEEDVERGRKKRPAMAEMPSFIAIGDSSGDEE